MLCGLFKEGLFSSRKGQPKGSNCYASGLSSKLLVLFMECIPLLTHLHVLACFSIWCCSSSVNILLFFFTIEDRWFDTFFSPFFKSSFILEFGLHATIKQTMTLCLEECTPQICHLWKFFGRLNENSLIFRFTCALVLGMDEHWAEICYIFLPNPGPSSIIWVGGVALEDGCIE